MMNNFKSKFYRYIVFGLGLVVITVFVAVIVSKPSPIIAQESAIKALFSDHDVEIIPFDQIPECKLSQTRISSRVAKEKSLYAESSLVINELDSLRVKFTKTEVEKARIIELESKYAKIEADLAANKAELELLSGKTGPSDECKTAFVKSILKNTNNHAEKLPIFLSNLDQVSAVIAKIEKALPELKKTSTNETLIKSIEDDINTINTNIKSLKSFFAEIKSEMDSFNSLANSNPIAAYDKMNKFGQDETRFKKSEGFAETMMAALSRLKSSLDTLINSSN